MKQLYTRIFLLVAMFALVKSKSTAQTGPFPDADPAVIAIVKQGPGDPSPTGNTIGSGAVLKFRVANNSATSAATGKIPAGSLLYTVQFNPYYTYASLLETSQFTVTYASAGPPDYVVQLTNIVDINPGDVFDFYINVIGTLPTNNPSGEIVTLNVDRNLPIACGNTQTGNDNVFSRFLVTAAGTLPVKLLDLSAVLHDQRVDLKWITKDEENVSRFELERSTDGRNFSGITTKQAVGNTIGETNYSHQDDIRMIGSTVIYYRVKAIDVNGEYYYSKIVTITLTKTGAIQAWPNPFTDKINLRINAAANGRAVARIYTVNGVVIKQMELVVSAGSNFLTIDGLEQLPKEIYIIQVMINNEKVFSDRLVK